MFACALYPSNKEFLDSVSEEVRQNIRRLQHHPSLALWAGNNENEMAIASFWWPQTVRLTRKMCFGQLLQHKYLKVNGEEDHIHFCMYAKYESDLWTVYVIVECG